MIPCDTENIKKEYDILLNELKMYKEELLHKPRLLAITKSDLIDEELKTMLQDELPESVETIFISAVAQQGLDELKDMIWRAIDKDL